MIRILIVEDRSEVRRGLQMRLAAEPDMRVVGLAADSREALALLDDLPPDVVLMDVEMPACDGIETCDIMHQRHPSIPVVFLTIHDDSATRARADTVRAAGFVCKDEPVECLLAAIRSAAGSAACTRGE